MLKLTHQLHAFGALMMLALTTGCAHKQLRFDSVAQARTVADVYEQQVLDNLAMFASNPHAVPWFSVLNNGTNSVVDVGRAETEALNLFRRNAGLSGQRQIQEGLSLVPVANPDQLSLMRCAYQRAVGLIDNYCAECAKREKAWSGRSIDELDPCCQITPGWFGVGSKADYLKYRAKNCKRCVKHGEHCGTHVWVLCGHEQDFSRLMLTILEYAVGRPVRPKSVPTKRVRLYVNSKGQAASADSAIGYVEAEMAVTDKLSRLLVVEDDQDIIDPDRPPGHPTDLPENGGSEIGPTLKNPGDRTDVFVPGNNAILSPRDPKPPTPIERVPEGAGPWVSPSSALELQQKLDALNPPDPG